MQRDCNAKMSHNKGMIESKDKHIKLLQARVDELCIENNAKEAEVMSMMEVIKEG